MEAPSDLRADLMTLDAVENEETLAEPIDSADVEVSTDRVEGRHRQLSARIQLPYSPEQLWQILTDYDHLADFVPNLAKSERLTHPQSIRIEQIGAEKFLNFKFRARVVLDMAENFPHQIAFQMVEGDFKEFSGSWNLHPISDRLTELSYTLNVLPPRTMPIALIERRLKRGFVVNLCAIRDRARELFGAIA
ncbi:SRPBCC family protein [Leptolyngbya ohadii]|uniref:SRPBCC family protein n=1 Tax=Leptolyngbya ohadii TaxID=1962290 RepID=UPI001CED695A|nr:SRPBCC family protein [Leptolyngbya ohadii]